MLGLPALWFAKEEVVYAVATEMCGRRRRVVFVMCPMRHCVDLMKRSSIDGGLRGSGTR